jgi:hypothetical protein
MTGRALRHPLVERILHYRDRVRAWARRATALGLAVRGVVWLTGAAGLLLASPWRPDITLPIACLLALPAAAAPSGWFVWLVELLAIGAVAANPEYPLWTLVPLAGLLYLHHTAAALAAQLRTDTAIPAAVLRRWAGRAGIVLGGSVPVGLGIAALAEAAPAWSATGYLGLGVAAAVVATAVLVRRASQSVAAPARNSSSAPVGTPNGPR